MLAIYSVGSFIAVASTSFGQATPADRQAVWIQGMDRSVSHDPDVKSKQGIAVPGRLSSQNEGWLGELKDKLHMTKEPWSDADATWVYQQLSRACLTGNVDLPQAGIVESTVLFPLKFQTQAKAMRRHAIIGWPVGSYALTISPHFSIAAQGSTKQATDIAKLCEQTYAIWRQLFFSYWCDSETLQRSLELKTPLRSANQERFQIVLFRNRDSYIKQLQQIEPNVAISTGYYSPKLKTVFCYWDEATSVATLRHELTHQFFSQLAGHEIVQPEELRSDFWLVEGLALYMESIQVVDEAGFEIATVGGWDAARLQPARYRRLHDETWIPWDEFRRANNERFRVGTEIKQWYSQAAGLTHFWMDRSAANRHLFLDYIKHIYRGLPEADSPIQTMEDERLRRDYDEFLIVSESKLLKDPPSSKAKELVLSRCPVTSDALLSWPESNRSLDWLDLSFCKIDDRLFLEPSESPSRKRWDVRRLNVESTLVSDASLTIIATMPRLEELDLSQCQITDRGLESFRGHKTLKSFWLTGNAGISNQGLAILSSLPRLEMVELSGTSVTEDGWKNLLSKSPRLRRKRAVP